MDYKSKLAQLVNDERAESESKKADETLFYQNMREAFAPMASTLQEISEVVDPGVASFNIGRFYARIQIGKTEYEIEPNHPGHIRFKPPEFDSAFKITTRTTFEYAEVDSIERSYVLKTAEAVSDELMKLLAKAIASKSRK